MSQLSQETNYESERGTQFGSNLSQLYNAATQEVCVSELPTQRIVNEIENEILRLISLPTCSQPAQEPQDRSGKNLGKLKNIIKASSNIHVDYSDTSLENSQRFSTSSGLHSESNDEPEVIFSSIASRNSVTNGQETGHHIVDHASQFDAEMSDDSQDTGNFFQRQQLFYTPVSPASTDSSAIEAPILKFGVWKENDEFYGEVATEILGNRKNVEFNLHKNGPFLVELLLHNLFATGYSVKKLLSLIRKNVKYYECLPKNE